MANHACKICDGTGLDYQDIDTPWGPRFETVTCSCVEPSEVISHADLVERIQAIREDAADIQIIDVEIKPDHYVWVWFRVAGEGRFLYCQDASLHEDICPIIEGVNA